MMKIYTHMRHIQTPIQLKADMMAGMIPRHIDSMKINSATLLTALAAISGSTVSATILAYEGFATDAAGTGINYEAGAVMGSFLTGAGSQFSPTNTATGVDKTRLGFTGGYGQVNGQMSGGVNLGSAIGNLSYPNFVPGTQSGMGNPFRDGGTAGSQKFTGREMTITNAGGQLDDGYFVAALVDFNNSGGGGFGFGVPGRENTFELNGATAAFTSAGSSGQSATGISVNASGTNLLVIQYTNETGGGLNANFYTRWNIWINPDLSGGTLDPGSIVATGFGIGLLNNGVINPPTLAYFSSSNLAGVESMFVDEFYVVTDPADFISVPEPSTYALLAGCATLGMIALRRRR